ncbi:MAG: endonuclease V [Ponticaulis sp.]|nr:endonuclease V [Ponticaulis sp.]
MLNELKNWPKTERDALDLQARLAAEVRAVPLNKPPETIAGVDVAYNDATGLLIAAITVLDAKTLNLVDQAVFEGKVDFPYVPGLFSFRELPPALEADRQLKIRPDLYICDGHGLAHPRHFGLACHLGLALNTPAIGCAKTHLYGTSCPPGELRGEKAPILDGDTQIGAVLRTQTGVKPVYVSIGHLITLDEAVAVTLNASPKYRLPETTRSADQLVRQRLKQASG